MPNFGASEREKKKRLSTTRVRVSTYRVRLWAKPNSFPKTWCGGYNGVGTERRWFDTLVRLSLFTTVGATICRWWGPQEERKRPSNTEPTAAARPIPEKPNLDDNKKPIRRMFFTALFSSVRQILLLLLTCSQWRTRRFLFIPISFEFLYGKVQMRLKRSARARKTRRSR